jgi:transcriptional regulator with XRE-family HTH domain
VSVTDEIRAMVKQVLQERHMTQTELAGKLSVTPQALSRTLNERGKVPGLWKGIFEELGLEITVKRVQK